MMHSDSWIDRYCAEKQGAEKVWQAEWESMKYLIGGKMFAFMGSYKSGAPIITMKLPPEEGASLRNTYPEAIIPGYYMNKIHWNSLFLEENVPEEILKQMLDSAYNTVLKSLSKKVQKQILEG